MPVLPWLPVSASTVRSGSRSTDVAGQRPSATTGSSTTTVGTPVGREPSTAAAPAATAPAAYSWPSTCSPTTATKSPPGSTARLSTKAGPVDGRVAVRDSRRRRRRSRRGSSRSSRAPRAPRGRPRGRRRDAPRRRSPGRSRGPCPPPARCRRGRRGARAVRIAARRSPTSRTSAAPSRGAGQHGGADRGRVLGARVVVGDHEHVGQPGRDLAHHRALARVAVAAGADHDDQPTGRQRAQRGQRGLDGVGLVGVVDDHVEVLPGVDPLESAGDAAGPAPAPLATGLRGRSRPRSSRRSRPARWRR